MFILIFLLFCSVGYAGVDLAMTSRYELPELHTKEEARLWAQTVGYSEPIRKKLFYRIGEIRRAAYLTDAKMGQDAIQNAGVLVPLAEYYEEALKIMDENKKNGVGSTLVVRSEVVQYGN